MNVNIKLPILACVTGLFTFFACSPSFTKKISQEAYAEKCTASVSTQILQKDRVLHTFLVRVNDMAALQKIIDAKKLSKRVVAEYANYQSFLLELTGKQLQAYILPSPAVVFVDLRDKTPIAEQLQQNHDPTVNQINAIQSQYPELAGQGLTASVKEYQFDTLDIDLSGRFVFYGTEASQQTLHSTDMATLLGGIGNSFYTSKGLAWQCRLSSSSFLRILPDEDLYFESLNISVQNHSYGLDIENYYGIEAEAYDIQAFHLPHLVHVFSAGNKGNQSSEAGLYAGLSGFANLTGNFKMAKNVLTVGAVDSFLRVKPLSSRGPSFDGRIKPELVAFGNDGSSGAAAITSGLAMICQQAYQDQTGLLPSSALLRAVLLNSADDIEQAGPDYLSGYGNVNAQRAVQTIKENHFFEAAVTDGEVRQFNVEIPSEAENLKIMLAWTDPAAGVNTQKALINDLDLRLVHTASGNDWLPWVLSTFPHADSLASSAIRTQDHLNNQEQITIAAPPGGSYMLEVKGTAIQTQDQAFTLVFQWDEKNHFDWGFPIKGNHVFAGAAQLIRWKSNDPTPAALSYKISGQEHWIPIADELDLRIPYAQWQAPDTFALAQMRMVIGAKEILSDTFTISKPLNIQTLVDCESELLLSWPSSRPLLNYRLFNFKSNQFSEILTTADTFAFLEKASYPPPYYAVEPIIEGSYTGIRSPAVNSDFQQADCYILSFSANLDGNSSALRLQLGALFHVAYFVFEKWIDGRFVPIATVPAGQALTIDHHDISLLEGPNIYRAQVVLNDGRALLSEEVSVFFLGNKDFYLYPNPAKSGGDITILAKTNTGAALQLFNALGQFSVRYFLPSEREILLLPELMPGAYFYQILEDGKQVSVGKILIRD